MDLLTDAQPQWILVGAVLLLATVAFLKVFLSSGGSGKQVPPTIPGAPVVGGLLRFLRGPILLIRAEYARLGPVFTVLILTRRIIFLIGPDVSAHFFKSDESDMSQQEVYRFNVPTFGPGVVFDVDYQVRQEQFKFSTEAGAREIQRHAQRSGRSASIRPRCEAGLSQGEACAGIDRKRGIRLQSMHLRAHRFTRRITRTMLLPPNDDARPAVISFARLGSPSNEARQPAAPPSGG